MAEDSKITNVNDIADSIGSTVGNRFDSAFRGFQKQQAEIASTQKLIGLEIALSLIQISDPTRPLYIS